MNDVVRGTRAWLAVGLLAVGVSASLLALTFLLAPGRWLQLGALAVVALAAVLGGIRATTRAWWAPTLGGALLSTFALLVLYASPPGRLQVLPDRESVARLGDLIRAGLQAADTSRPPAEPTLPLELLVVGGALLVMLAADLIALGLGAPAWAGLAMLALWIPSIVIGRPGSTQGFVGAALAYLLLLAVSAAPATSSRRRRSPEEHRRRATAAATIAGGVIVVALVVGPLGTVLPGWSTVRLPQVGSSTGGSLQLADDLDMRQSLGTRSSEVVLSYRADPALAGPLRVFTLRDYDGETWSREQDDTDLPPVEAGTLLWPTRDLTPEPPGEGEPSTTRLDVRLEGLREDRLPVPVMPRTLFVDDRLTYDSRRDEVVRAGLTRSGMQYSMEVELLDLTDDTLRASGEDDPRDVAQYLDLPETSRVDDIERAAREVVDGESGRYDQALALQNYFRSTQNFTYTIDVDPARSDDAVWDFLGSRTGYCVQFATAMTIMARTLGIPARLAVGFLPGTPADSGEYVVTGRDSHAWPELYFPDAGWIRFEPTPRVQSGAPPAWADPFAGTGSTPFIEPEPTGAAGDLGPLPSAAPVPQATTAAPTDTTPGYLVPVGIATGVLLLGAAAYLLRRRLSVAEELRPEAAWAHLRKRLAASGIVWTDAHTTRQAAELVAAEIAARRGGPMDPAARRALVDLARAVEDHRYAAAPRVWSHADLEQRVADVLREVAAATPARSGRRG
ncbi:transglutaminase [Cellulomonas aerilata]|uniref:Transglutaminase n=2 Tax=Cellulomonas aerilata TaxID=515326 RepID=A0A512DGJ4_9CELL|nr:transglutaminase [Cellulomonas aerilata]